MSFPTTATQVDRSRTYQLRLDQRAGPHLDIPLQCAAPSRAQMDPPRPLEPRPTHTLQSSLSESSANLRRRNDIFTGSVAHQTSARPPHFLPALRDILSESGSVSATAATPSQLPFSSWNTTTTFTAGPNPETYHQPRGIHPPLAYPPRPPKHYAPHLTSHDRRLELPILETQPVPRYQPPAALNSPYVPYHETANDLSDARVSRPRQHSTGSYVPNPLSSPYATPHYDDAGSRSNGPFDRNVNPAFAPTSAETTKRYLGIQEVPGEGKYHVYEGGHRIPTHVDGESVNPQWGLTKANKPRKRLALACLDCREKKIKCEPGASSCLQCEKAQRPCRRAPHSQVHHEGQPSADWSSTAGSPPATRPGQSVSDPTPLPGREVDTTTFAKRRALDDSSIAGMQAKKQRSLSPMTLASELSASASSVAAHVPPEQMPPSVPQAPRFFTADDDPFAVDPGLTLHLMDSYFTHVNTGIYCMLPRESFMRWLTTCSNKNPEDRMVLHAMLAMASVFDQDRAVEVGDRCAVISANLLAPRTGLFSLQLVHTRLLIALYNLSRGIEGSAWDLCGSAARASSALRYNNERGCAKPAPPGTPNDYGLSTEQTVECRRRTFWTCFMMDRFNGFCGGMVCTINKRDVYLRLPCADEQYEKGSPSGVPFFDNGSIDQSFTVVMPNSHVSPVAYLCLVTSIWGNVMSFVHRAVHHSPIGYATVYETFYRNMQHALQTWLARLPHYLQYSKDNLARSVHEGYAGTFVSMHALYHYTLIKLNRCVRHSLLLEVVPRNIREAHSQAHQLLSIVCALHRIREEPNGLTAEHARWYSSSPFVGYALLSATDVVAAGGPDSNLKPTMENMQGGLAFLRDLGVYWPSAKDQARAGETRYLQLQNVLSRPYKAISGCWLGRQWGLKEPLEKDFNLEDDCIYGVNDNVYFEALGNVGTGVALPAGPQVAH